MNLFRTNLVNNDTFKLDCNPFDLFRCYSIHSIVVSYSIQLLCLNSVHVRNRQVDTFFSSTFVCVWLFAFIWFYFYLRLTNSISIAIINYLIIICSRIRPNQWYIVIRHQTIWAQYTQLNDNQQKIIELIGCKLILVTFFNAIMKKKQQ